MKLNDESRKLLESHPDFILLNRYSNSVNKILERYPEGPPDHIIAESLGLTEEELEVRTCP